MLGWVMMVACCTGGRAEKLGWVQRNELIQTAAENYLSPSCPFLVHFLFPHFLTSGKREVLGGM